MAELRWGVVWVRIPCAAVLGFFFSVACAGDAGLVWALLLLHSILEIFSGG